ncbi:mucin-22-like isoform X3 [Scylla paramamosain]|uniref:mucin-22-like isoform X3 n=1 Tax=Scylla paramamosain TaxID=85552 RepID=UPI003082FDFE
MARQQVAVILLLAKVVCGGVVGDIERQETGSQCGDTLFLDFSNRWPEVHCSSPCPDVHAWAAGPVFKRESRLEQYGLMVRQEYGEDGVVTCSLVDDISDTVAIQSSLQAEACSSVTPFTTTTTTGTGGPSGVTETTTTTGTGGPSGVTETTTTTGTGGPSGVTEITTTTGTGGPSGVTETTTTTGTGGPSGVTETTTTTGTGGPSGVTETTTTTGTGGPSGVTETTTTTTTGTGGPSGVTETTTTTTTGTGGPSGVTETTTPTGTGGPSGVTETTTTTTTGTGGPSGVTGSTTSTIITEPGTSPSTVTVESTTLIECVTDKETEITTTPQTTTVVPTTTEPRWVCESGWSLYESSCYQIDKNVKFDWMQGQIYCNALNAEYAKITSTDQASFLRALATDDTWIGLTDQSTEGNFIWTDTSVPVFNEWAPGEPNSAGEEDCTEMRKGKDFWWNDSSCGNIKSVLCQKPATKMG